MREFFQKVFQFFIFEKFLSIKMQYFLIFMLSLGIILIFKFDLNAGLSFIIATIFIIFISYLKVYNTDLFEKIMDLF
jgi:hypothetical protein